MRRNVPPAAYRGESFVDAARNRSRLSRGQDFTAWDLPPRRPSTSYECRAVFYQVRLGGTSRRNVGFSIASRTVSNNGSFLAEFLCGTSLRPASYDFLPRFFPPFPFLFFFLAQPFLHRAYRGSKITSPTRHVFGLYNITNFFFCDTYSLVIHICFI